MKRGFPLAFALMIFTSVLPSVAEESRQSLASSAFVQGAGAFRSGDWIGAVFMLRRAVSYPENYNQETWYMLVTAQMYAGEYRNAYQDCETYLESFPDSAYEPYIVYYRGRALFCLGEYERSILLLGDFCHLYPEHEMYASALFWMAESFYALYCFEEAGSLYSRIVNEFSDDAKASEAQYRIETISQKAREEKLLYLLKETGEEYLAAKEEYERQLKLSGSETAVDIRRRMMDLQLRNSELEKKIGELEKVKSNLQAELQGMAGTVSSMQDSKADMLNALKGKARAAESLLRMKEGAEVSK